MTEIERLFIDRVSKNSIINRGINEEEYLQRIKDILDNFKYPYEITSNQIIISFPDYICTDSYGNTTPIYQTFIAIDCSSIITVRRTKFTELQYNEEYIHSHVSGDLNIWASTICYGPNIITHSSFLATLIGALSFYPTFLSEESTMTYPYKRLNSFGIGHIEKRYASTVNSFRDFLPFLQVKIKSVYGLQKLYVVITDHEKFNETLLRQNASCYMINDIAYVSIKVSAANEVVKQRILTNFVFKGEPQYIEFVKDNTPIPKKIACVLTKDYIINKLNNFINEGEFFQD